MEPLTRVLLDTSVLIGDDVVERDEELAISAVSLAELHYGVLRPGLSDSQRADRLARLSRVQRTFDALPVDEAVAEAYGRLAAQATVTGRQPPRRVADLLIAATAYVHGAHLLTRNPDDVAGLENYVSVIAL